MVTEMTWAIKANGWYLVEVELSPTSGIEDKSWANNQGQAFRFSSLQLAKNICEQLQEESDCSVFRLTKKEKLQDICNSDCKYMETYVLQLKDGRYLEQCVVNQNGLLAYCTADLNEALKFAQPIADETAKALNTIQNCYPFKSVKLKYKCYCKEVY